MSVCLCLVGRYIYVCGRFSTHVGICFLYVPTCAGVCVNGRAYQAEGQHTMRSCGMGTEVSYTAILGCGDI